MDGSAASGTQQREVSVRNRRWAVRSARQPFPGAVARRAAGVARLAQAARGASGIAWLASGVIAVTNETGLERPTYPPAIRHLFTAYSAAVPGGKSRFRKRMNAKRAEPVQKGERGRNSRRTRNRARAFFRVLA